MAFCDDPAHHWVRDTWATMPLDPRCPMTTAAGPPMTGRRTIGIGVVGLRLDGPGPQPQLPAHPRAVPRPCGRSRARGVRRRRRAQRRDAAVADFGFGTATDDWREVVDAPRRRRRGRDRAQHAARRDRRRPPPPPARRVFCEKPVGGTPAQTVAAERAAPPASSPASATTTAGRRSCSTPRELIDDGRLGHDHQLPRPVPVVLRQRPARRCCRGGSWSTRAATASRTDLLSHSRRPRPLPRRRHHRGRRHRRDVHHASGRCRRAGGTHYDRGAAGDPTRRRHQRGLRPAAIVRFAGGAIGHVRVVADDGRARRARTPSRCTARSARCRWNFERMNELQVHVRRRRPADRLHDGVRRRALRRPRRVRARAAPTRSASRTWSTIEDHQFLAAVAEGRPFDPGFGGRPRLRQRAGRPARARGRRGRGTPRRATSAEEGRRCERPSASPPPTRSCATSSPNEP